MKDFHLYLITDRKQAKGENLVAVVEAALRGGVKAVQLREKDLSTRELFALAGELRTITERHGAVLLINDRIDIALAVGADGVHLGEKSMPVSVAGKLLGGGKLIGVSCHCRESALAAQEEGADFITFGPVFFTPSKAPYGDPVGLGALEETAKLLRTPVYALGGIKRENIGEVMSRGARGIALISAIISADDPEREAAELLTLL